MKKRINLFFMFLIMFMASSLVACVPLPPVDGGQTENPSIKDDFNCISLAEANKIAVESGEAGTNEIYYVYGTVDTVLNPMFGEMNITDGTEVFHIYGIQGKDGTPYDKLSYQPKAGDEVVVSGKLKAFNSKPEMGRGTLEAYVEHKVIVNPDDYKKVTVLEARNVEDKTAVSVSGVVAKLTYANGMKPNGFFLVDESSSIYVYGNDAAQRVAEGNRVTLSGIKTSYTNPKEQSSATKYNYPGSIQITNAKVTEVDGKQNEVNLSWVKESTVKEVVESRDFNSLTGNIVKVTAVIKQQVNPGFTNYYFDDLDNKTGSYAYSSNNGKDYEYLAEFNNQICEVYLSVINYKCTSSGVTPRFVPIQIKPIEYTMKDEQVPEFVYTYYIKDEMKETLFTETNLELVSSVTNELFDLSAVKITYTSLTPEIISIENATLKTLQEGLGKFKVSIAYKEQVVEHEFTINVLKKQTIESISIKEAIAASDNTEVTIKGIVLSSLVNRTGFYLIDETGVIAVTTSQEALADIELGNELVLKGMRIHKKKDTTGPEIIGQTVIDSAVILANDYNKHEYTDTLFDKTKTIDDLYALNVKDDETTTVYTVKTKVIVEKGQYSTNIYLASLTNPEVKIALYCSGESQYSFLTKYKDQEVTVELAMCNWNDKKFYKACVISVSDGTTKVVNNLNFAK